DVSNLQPNTTYHFALFEYNGYNGKVFLRPGATGSQTTASAPTVAASNFTVSNLDGDRFYMYFTAGDGARRLIVAREGSPVTAVPADGTSYSGNTTFGSGEEISSGEYVVYSGTSTGTWLYGLDPSTTYHFAVYEYNGTDTSTFYLTDTLLVASQATLGAPAIQSSNAFLSSRSNNSLNISWTKSDGANRILIARKDGPVNVEPEDLTSYSSSAYYGSREIGTTGNYVLYSSSGNNVNVRSLEPGTNYYFSLFEYNGNNARLYLRPGYAFALETFGDRPTVQVSNAQFSNVDYTSFDVHFTRGDGTRRLVLAREGSPVIGGPVDFTSYSANSVFGTGDEIGSGNFVVYNDIGENFSLTGLESGKTYYFAFFEYTVSDLGELYLSPSYTTSKTTLADVDVSLSGIISPTSNCNLGESETVTIEISNLNSVAVDSLAVAYILDGSEPVVEILNAQSFSG
ncbi:MAG: hypothetical protein ACK5M7_02675, partial [Draconibacterium sp.]